jgi:uncharacterized membrane protein
MVRYSLVLIGLILVASGFYIHTYLQVPVGTDQYSIGNHAYETEVYSTIPILQTVGLTCVSIGIAFIICALALAFLKTNPKPEPQEPTSAQQEAHIT